MFGTNSQLINKHVPMGPQPCPGKSLPPNPTQGKTSAVKGKEIKKRKNLTYSEKYERVKLIDSGE